MSDKKENLIPIYELSKLCERFNITKKTIFEKKGDFHQIINEYFQSNPEFNLNKSEVLQGLKYFLK